LHATRAGDVERVVSLLAEDAVLISDGGADFRAARRPVRGRDRMARFLVSVARRLGDVTFEPMPINGELGLVASEDGRRTLAMSFQVEGDRVQSVHIIRNAEKLASLDHPVDVL
ncbi:MAG: nuclear transport factor 2 family protein, partial [Acidimicrobiia bacterium]